MRYFSLGQQKILFILALFILVIFYFRFFYHPALPPEEIYQEIAVEVLGEVRKPGLYLFQKPPTLKETIERAGGLKEPARLDTDSSAEILETGALVTIVKEPQKIPPYPPSVNPPSPFNKGGDRGIKIKIGRMEARKLLVFSIPLDLNRVSAEDLCLIPGIGESLAREIVAYRESRKAFRSVEELKNLKGIGEKKFQSFKSHLVVRP